jgi:hypothetical protein
MDVCLLCVLSGRGLCDELITRPEKSYRLWRIVVCSKNLVIRGGHGPRWAAEPEKIMIIINSKWQFLDCATISFNERFFFHNSLIKMHFILP